MLVFLKAPLFFLHVDLGIKFRMFDLSAILVDAYVKECDVPMCMLSGDGIVNSLFA